MSQEITNIELLEAMNAGFTAVEKRFQDLESKVSGVEESLSHKIDGLSNRIDTEILRRTDEHADHEERITALEVETGLAERSV